MNRSRSSEYTYLTIVIIVLIYFDSSSFLNFVISDTILMEGKNFEYSLSAVTSIIDAGLRDKEILVYL
jgi:hypothetical protein